MILLWGLPGDAPLDAVTRELARRGSDFVQLDQRTVLEQRLELEIGDSLAGVLRVRETAIDLERIRAAYVRSYDSGELAHVVEAGAAAQLQARELEWALAGWLEETPARVVNRPSSMASNDSKPFQARHIEACGFHVPPTLVTTDPAAARAFQERHGELIYKSVSGVRSMVSRLRPQDVERLEDIVWCPTQLQAWIPGREHRAHVVGDEVFATEIVCDGDDYRYAPRQGIALELRATELPAEIAQRARQVAAALDLHIAGLDLRRTPDGAWYCFEANPSPCFTYYEAQTGQPITAAVAALLAGA